MTGQYEHVFNVLLLTELCSRMSGAGCSTAVKSTLLVHWGLFKARLREFWKIGKADFSEGRPPVQISKDAEVFDL